MEREKARAIIGMTVGLQESAFSGDLMAVTVIAAGLIDILRKDAEIDDAITASQLYRLKEEAQVYLMREEK